MFALIPWWVKAGVVGLLLFVVFGAGWKVRDAFCDSAAAKRDLAIQQQLADDLRNQLTTFQAAADQDAIRAMEDQKEIARLEGLAHDLETRVADGACLDSDTVDGLRSLWPESAR